MPNKKPQTKFYRQTTGSHDKHMSFTILHHVQPFVSFRAAKNIIMNSTLNINHCCMIAHGLQQVWRDFIRWSASLLSGSSCPVTWCSFKHLCKGHNAGFPWPLCSTHMMFFSELVSFFCWWLIFRKCGRRINSQLARVHLKSPKCIVVTRDCVGLCL